MFCGTGSFSRVDEDPCSLPTSRGSKRKHGGNNPYSTRGLDKFSTVVADLQARRDKIMGQAGEQGAAALVRFVYSNSHDWVPIVVRPRQQQPEPRTPEKCPAGEVQEDKPGAAAKGHTAAPVPSRAVKKGFSWKVHGREGASCLLGWRWNPSYSCLVVVALILLCMVFGRAFAICCTSIWWYLVPCITGDESLGGSKAMKKKEYKRTNEKMRGADGGDGALTPPPAKKDRDLVGSASPRHHGRGGIAKKRRC